MFVRIIIFVILIILASGGPVWLLLPGLVVYGLMYSGYELIFLGLFIDALFMHSGAIIPLYTVGITLWLIFAELAKPYLVLYNQSQ